jgi:hypothetical protein
LTRGSCFAVLQIYVESVCTSKYIFSAASIATTFQMKGAQGLMKTVAACQATGRGTQYQCLPCISLQVAANIKHNTRKPTWSSRAGPTGPHTGWYFNDGRTSGSTDYSRGSCEAATMSLMCARWCAARSLCSSKGCQCALHLLSTHLLCRGQSGAVTIKLWWGYSTQPRILSQV